MAASERKGLDVTWRSQEDWVGDENAIAVIDGSGSMYYFNNAEPAAIALSLGIYFAERNTGVFGGHFITFSSSPQLVEIKGADIFEKVKYCRGFNEVANTNIEAVFRLILDTAVKNNVPQDELPKAIYIISDMEFDMCAENSDVSNFENAKRMYAAAGYKLPQVVFWNVASRNRQQPVKLNEQGVALVSGASPQVFSMLQRGTLSPMAFMLDVLGSERYAAIRV
jgi:hypothetical protein